MSRAIALCLAVVALPLAAAAADEDLDVTRARERFTVGQGKFNTGDYAGALKEFETARLIKAVPEFDYNIGICLEHLGRYREAIDALTAYLSSTVDPAAVNETKQRIARLEEALAREQAQKKDAQAPAAAPLVYVAPAPPPSPSYAAPVGVGVAALALAAVGVALVAPVFHEYSLVSSEWDRSPSPTLAQEADYLKTRLEVGYAMLGVAGAVAIVDIILWARAGRREAPGKPLPAQPLPGRAAAFSF